MEIYAVSVSRPGEVPKISCEAYTELDDAIQYITSRTGNPQRIGDTFTFYGGGHFYAIEFLTVSKKSTAKPHF
jgi:hypothetical protein